MLHFENLKKTHNYFQYINKLLPNKTIFFVGGLIRDLLLNIQKEPFEDIDITCAGNPKDIITKINKENISIFQTEKYGTITIVPKKNKQIKYEITPLRQEGQYLDFRHPSEIKWSKSIIEDSKRRDFTINALYLTFVNGLNINLQNIEKLQTKKDKTKENIFIEILEKEGNILISEKNYTVLILTKDIETIFPDGQLDINYLKKEVNKIKTIYLSELSNKVGNIYILIDPWLGIKDLINKKLKAVDNPDNRFQEDALRIIRGIRFINILNIKLKKSYKKNIEDKNISGAWMKQNNFFDFEPKTWLSMKKNYYLVKFLPKERVKEEILKVFKEENPFGFIALMDELNILKYFFNYLYLTKGVNQPIRYHPLDTYHHIIMTLYHLQKINKNYLTKFGMLYHDVAKPDQYYLANLGLTDEERKKLHGTYIHHPKQGIDFVKEDFKKLGFSKKEIEEIAWYVEKHMLPGERLRGKPKNIEKNLTKLISEVGKEKVLNLIDISIADRLGQYNPIQDPDIEGLKKMKNLVKEIVKKQGEFKLKDLAINGNDIIEYFKLTPGPEVGKLLQQAFDRVIENVKERNKKEIILNYLKNILPSK